MAKNIHDLNNAAKSFHDGLERRAQERGEQAADRLLAATRNYGGLWFLVRGPLSVVIGLIVAMIAERLMGLGLIASGIVLFGVTWAWYYYRPIRVHPLIEFPIVMVGLTLLVGFVR